MIKVDSIVANAYVLLKYFFVQDIKKKFLQASHLDKVTIPSAQYFFLHYIVCIISSDKV